MMDTMKLQSIADQIDDATMIQHDARLSLIAAIALQQGKGTLVRIEKLYAEFMTKTNKVEALRDDWRRCMGTES